MNKKITDIRIQKELQSIEKQPIPSVVLQRQSYLHFHFCFHGLQESYQGGFYHGVLELPQDYPFSPPKIKFITNNGRFQVGKSICTSFTHYHKETWSSSWNIRTILTAMISFMYCDQRGIGAVFQTSAKRKQLAAKSLEQNLKNQQFVRLFKDKLIELKIVTEQHINGLFKKIEKAKHRKRARSQTTHADQIRDYFQLPYQIEGYPEIKQQGLAGHQDEENNNRVNMDQFEENQIEQYQVIQKKQKLDLTECIKQEMGIKMKEEREKL